MAEAGEKRWRAGGGGGGEKSLCFVYMSAMYTPSSCDVFVQYIFTCNETKDLLVFSLTPARAPFSPEVLSVISRAALSSLGVSFLAAAATGGRGGSLAFSLGSGFFPLVSIFLW